MVQTFLWLPYLLFNMHINIFCFFKEQSFTQNITGNGKSNIIKTCSAKKSVILSDSRLVMNDDTTKKTVVKVYTTGPLPTQDKTLSDSTTVENALIILPGITKDTSGAIMLTDSIKESLKPHYDSIIEILNSR